MPLGFCRATVHPTPIAASLFRGFIRLLLAILDAILAAALALATPIHAHAAA